MTVPMPKLAEFREQLLASTDAFTPTRILRDLKTFSDLDPEVWEIRGLAYRQLCRMEESTRSFWEAYQLSGHIVHFYYYAYALAHTSKQAEGISILERLVGEKLPISELYGSLADLHAQKKDIDSTLRVLSAGLEVRELVSSYHLFRLMQSFFLAGSGATEEAKETALKAMRLVFKKEFPNLGEVPLPGAIEAIKHLPFFSFSYVNSRRYYDFLEQAIQAAKNSPSRAKDMQAARLKSLSRLKSVYSERIQPNEKTFSYAATGNSEAANEELFNAMAPYTRAANETIG